MYTLKLVLSPESSHPMRHAYKFFWHQHLLNVLELFLRVTVSGFS